MVRQAAQVAQHVDQEDFMGNWLAADEEQDLRETLLREEHYLSLRLHKRSRTSTLIKSAIRDLLLPEESLIALIHRDGRVLFPRGGTVLQEGDHLTIVGLPDGIKELRERYVDD